MPTLQVPLLVVERPHVVQLPAREGLDHAFYDSLLPSTPVIWVHSAIRDYEDPVDLHGKVPVEVPREGVQHVAGLRNRGLYLQLLEALFAHIVANVQFPVAPQAWLVRYKPSDLRRFVRALRQVPWAAVPHAPVLDHPDDLVHWLFGIEQMSSLSADEVSAEIAAIQAAISLLAGDYTQDGLDKEYNSAKHGIRAKPAPWSLRLSPTGQPDQVAEMRATHGTHFMVEERGPRRASHYFALQQRSQSWHPERDLKLAQIAAFLLHNLILARRTPGDQPRLFYSFRGLDLRELALLVQEVGHFEVGVPLDVPADIRTRAQAAADALELAKDFAVSVARRRTEVAAAQAASAASDGGPGEIDPSE